MNILSWWDLSCDGQLGGTSGYTPCYPAACILLNFIAAHTLALLQPAR